MWQQTGSASPHIRSIWRATVDQPVLYTIPASEFWGISFARRPDGSMRAELDGPSLVARTVGSIRGERYWGVELGAHVVVPGVEKSAILGITAELALEDGLVRLGGRRVPVPEWPELEDFVERLIATGALESDPYVQRGMRGDEVGYSRRSWQRRFRAVTGITRKQIEQLERARRAFALLRRGIHAAEVAQLAGYADQSHMTRSLKLIRGETPARTRANSTGTG